MNDVQVMKMAETVCGLIKHFFDWNHFSQLVSGFAFDVILKSGSAQLNCDVAELAIAFRAEISHDILMRIRFSKQGDFAIGQSEALRQKTFNCHITLLKITTKDESSLASFTKHVARIERNLSNFNQFI